MKPNPFPSNFRHIQQVLTDVNAATGELFTSDALARKGQEEEKTVERNQQPKVDAKDKNDDPAHYGTKPGHFET